MLSLEDNDDKNKTKHNIRTCFFLKYILYFRIALLVATVAYTDSMPSDRIAPTPPAKKKKATCWP